jgi:glutaredoxin
MRPPEVVLYGQPECHLCDRARAELEALHAEGAEFELREVDISSDRELLKRYLERIPVVEVEGEVVCELWLDAEGLRARLDTVST